MGLLFGTRKYCVVCGEAGGHFYLREKHHKQYLVEQAEKYGIKLDTYSKSVPPVMHERCEQQLSAMIAIKKQSNPPAATASALHDR